MKDNLNNEQRGPLEATVTSATVEPIMQFFTYKHLRDDLKEVSKPFCAVADWIVERLPRNPERTVALRKLLEAKDAAVRAALMK